MVDLPAGATGRIANNLFVQGSDKENRSALIAVAAEGADNPSRGLAITGNRASLSPETSWPSVFVADWSGESLAIGANDLGRSEEHTSELQSLMRISYAVFCLKKKQKHTVHACHEPTYPQ